MRQSHPDNQPNNQHVSKRFKTVLAAFLGILLIAVVGVFLVKQMSGGGKDPIRTLQPEMMQTNILGPDEVVVFFSKNRGNTMVTEGVIRKVGNVPDSEKLALAIRELLAGPNEEEATQGFFTEIPSETEFLGIDQDQEGLHINLSQDFTSGGGSNTMQQRLKEVSHTVLAVERKQPVYLDVEGERLEVLGGEGVMVTEPINQPGDSLQ